MKISELVKNIKEKPFIQSIMKELNGEVFLVGGVVRDFLLKKPNKDIDLIVRNVNINVLLNHLNKFGKVNQVGKSFGVIKLLTDDGLDYDIALPRTEKSTGEGHTDFDVDFDENLPIEADLIRRDAKINSMAINLNNEEFLDPFGGLRDIKNKIMSMTNPEAFFDDPLRMLRMIGFAARFDFDIEPETFKAIQNAASTIQQVPTERWVEELQKIVDKGDPLKGAQLLKDSGLMRAMFGRDKPIKAVPEWGAVRTMGEFVYMLADQLVESPAKFFLKNFINEDAKKNNTAKEIKALEDGIRNVSNIDAKNRALVNLMYGTFPPSIDSEILPEKLKVAVKEMKSGRYPLSIKDLDINGGDLMKMGMPQGEIMGKTLRGLLLATYEDKVKNRKEDLLKYVQESMGQSENLTESEDKMKKKNVAYTGVVLDEKSRSKLLGMLGNNIPAGWEKIAHHLTINMGSIPPEWEDLVGKEFDLKVTHVGYNDKVMAVGVETDAPTKNKPPHITIAVNREAGGKPFMSKQIEKWKTIAFGLDLKGKVTEVPR